MATWEENAASIISNVENGTASASQIEWYNKWLASGQPSSKDGMMSWEAYNTITYGGGGDSNQVKSGDVAPTDWSTLSSYLTPDGKLRDDLTTAQLWEISEGGLGITSNQLPTVSGLIDQARARLDAGTGVVDPNQLSDRDQAMYNAYYDGTMTAAQRDQFYRTNGARLGLEAPEGYVADPDPGLTLGGYENEFGESVDREGNVLDPTTGLPPVTGGGGGVDPEAGLLPWEGQSDGATWNWDWFSENLNAPGWGGFDDEYGVYEKYQPGQESIWGNPDRMGGNEEFYQQQFGNLLRQSQGFQTRQRAAQLRAQQAAEERANQGPVDFAGMWESMGFEPNRAVVAPTTPEGGASTDWSLNPRYGFEHGMTNQEVVNRLNSIWTPQESAQWSSYFGEDGGNADAQYWASRQVMSDPNVILSGFQNVSPEFGSTVQKLINNLWQAPGQGTGAVYEGGLSVPYGYAAPV